MESLTNKEFNPRNLPTVIYSRLLELDESVDVEMTEGDITYTSNNFTLTLTLDRGVINIRNIETSVPGFGARVIEILKELAINYKYSLCALNVKDTAVGFWEKLGFEVVDGATYACNL